MNRFSEITALIGHVYLREAWDGWNKIANEVIPPGYDLRQHLERVPRFCSEWDSIRDQDVRDALDIFRTNGTIESCFVADFRFRQKLGIPQR